jgi:hypothetical protein
MLLTPAFNSATPSLSDERTSTLRSTDIDIPFPHDAEDAIFLFDFMLTRDIPLICTFERYNRLLGLCDRYGCDIIVERIISRLDPLISQAPWAVFCLASHAGDVNLARKALCMLHLEKEERDLGALSMSVASASKCTLPYLMGFFRLVPSYKLSEGNDRLYWSDVAPYFVPVSK